MRIILTRDLKGPKATQHGFVEGAAFDWPRSVITAVSTQEGDEKWYRFSAELERRRNIAAMSEEKSPEKESSDSGIAEEKPQGRKRRVAVTEELEV